MRGPSKLNYASPHIDSGRRATEIGFLIQEIAFSLGVLALLGGVLAMISLALARLLY